MVEQSAREPITRVEIAAYVLAGAGLLLVLLTHTVTGLLAGFLVFTVLHRTTALLRGPRVSHGVAKALAGGALLTVAVLVSLLTGWGLLAFAKGHLGDLPALFQTLATVLDHVHDRLEPLGFPISDLDALQTGDQVKDAVVTWLREHGGTMTQAGGKASRFLIHLLMGILAAILVFIRHPSGKPRPLAAALAARVTVFSESFDRVVVAQFKISAINTSITAVYLLGLVPLSGHHLPLQGTLIGLTFVVGLLPVIGNLISNTVIVLVSLSVSPWLALASLGFLIVIHKLEYLVNARIVGSQIGAQAWEIFLSIVAFEIVFGTPGAVIAPVAYAWIKVELAHRDLV